MTGKLCILGCHNFAQEVQASIRAEGWVDVISVDFPSRCGRPPVTWTEIRSALPGDCTHAVLVGRACMASIGPVPSDFPPTRVVVLEQCFHLIAGQALVGNAITDGGYLMSPSWLADWRVQVQAMGFTPDSAGPFFRDFARQLVLLDTGISPDTALHLREISETLGLPARREVVELDHMRLLLRTWVLQWRLDQEQQAAKERQRNHSRELADHVSAMDFLGKLTKTRQESEVIETIENQFRMLFAPAVWHYLHANNGHLVETGQAPPDVLAVVRQLNAPYAWTPSGAGFILRIARDTQLLGYLVADGLAFPAHRERYLNLALAMVDVMALAIENARTRKRLVEAEKMASLGVMVAGVAHEINTPVGVGVLAASTLQEQTGTLQQSFAERRMTQSQLQGYLEDTHAQARLILSNLERVGRLIDKFRQVAVDGVPQAKTAFKLRDCLTDVVASLGDRIVPGRFEVLVECEDTLQIASYPGDWASIFTNLLGNSLQHGFRGLDHGCMRIRIEISDEYLTVLYRDDGCGLSALAQKRVFDPFFTTDMQSGIGLGMHLVYNLITQRLGGNITVESVHEPGACFRIEIPQQEIRVPA